MNKFANVLGAFADSAVLFPLMALLTLKSGFSSPLVLFSAGVAYLVSSRYFGIPMPVQPLKSIVVTAVAVGASFMEVRISAFILGVFCLGLLYFKAERFAKRVPDAIIHQLQMGLGILLLFQGLRSDFSLLSVTGTVILIMFPQFKQIPLLGLVSTLGLLIAIFTSDKASSETVIFNTLMFEGKTRWGTILSLLLPQLALTMTNSVLATRDVSVRTYGDRAAKVTIPRLLTSIGLGNVFASIFGGLPFCHGSGGVTAHSRGGSTQSWSTLVIGMVLILLALIEAFKGVRELVIPSSIVAMLLIATGWFHIQLAKPTWASKDGRKKLIITGLVVLFTRNLLWSLAVGIALEFYEYYSQIEEDDDSVS